MCPHFRYTHRHTARYEVWICNNNAKLTKNKELVACLLYPWNGLMNIVCFLLSYVGRNGGMSPRAFIKDMSWLWAMKSRSFLSLSMLLRKWLWALNVLTEAGNLREVIFSGRSVSAVVLVHPNCACCFMHILSNAPLIVHTRPRLKF